MIGYESVDLPFAIFLYYPSKRAPI